VAQDSNEKAREMTRPRLLGGRYELDGVVGRGGMAEVYRAHDIRLDRIVAVKTLRADVARDQNLQARFRREAQSAASLNHPSIIAVYDTGEDTAGDVGVPYIVMEYADGRTLGDLLHDGRKLLVQRCLEITDGVLRALEYSHDNGIVHRDIKPANVMLTRSGDIKVMDFGIARALSGGQATITQTAQVIGTAQYMSPEQARGERVDGRSDLYSTGCLLYELLTGRPPFSGDSPVAIAYQHVRENPVPPSQIDPEIPRWAEAITLNAMAKAPADRYQNAAEMRADIQRALSGMPVSPLRTQMHQQTERVNGPAVAAPPTGAAPGLPTGAAPGLPTGAVPGMQYGAAGKPPSRRRRRAVWWMLSGLVVLAAGIAVAYLALAGGGRGGGAGSYAIPDVRGMTQQQADDSLTAKHLQPRFTTRNSQSVAKGHVINTNPAAGAIVSADSVVDVFVSAGRKQVTVPNVVGEDVNTAQTKLTNAHLKPVVKTDNTSTAPANTVVRQNPTEGTKLNQGSHVTIYVSGSGVEVPDVRGDPADSATSILQSEGFRVNEVKRSYSSSVAAGTVYAQNPPGGTHLAQGSTVTIYVQQVTPGIVAAPTALSVTQASSGTFAVTLSAAPTKDVTVTVSFTSGNAGLSVTSGGTLTFTPSNWNTAQDVTITADAASTGSATFTAAAPGYTPVSITATETSGSGASTAAPASSAG